MVSLKKLGNCLSFFLSPPCCLHCKKALGERSHFCENCFEKIQPIVSYELSITQNKNIKVHVWVDETRPRNQGASLTAWELLHHGVPHTVISDNAGGHLMQHGLVDICIVGTDRTTYTGDVANKIGTYLKALAAKDNNIPFYVALPSSSFDWKIKNGIKEIPIEQRGGEEVKYAQGLVNGQIKKVLLTPKDSPAANFAFDVTPRKLIAGLITERGICEASEKSWQILDPIFWSICGERIVRDIKRVFIKIFKLVRFKKLAKCRRTSCACFKKMGFFTSYSTFCH